MIVVLGRATSRPSAFELGGFDFGGTPGGTAAAAADCCPRVEDFVNEAMAR
jgi:hypothetical protein